MIEIFSDGACRGNPGGKGGWGTIIRSGTEEFELSGHEPDTTNNRMELTAAYHGLKYAVTNFPAEKNIMLCSDSKYVLDGIMSWMPSWKKNNWKASGGKIVKNLDLWMMFDKLIGKDLVINCVWVRGHAGHAENERADTLANLAIDEGRLVPSLSTVAHEVQESNEPGDASIIRLSGEAMGFEVGEWSDKARGFMVRVNGKATWWNPMAYESQVLDLMSHLNIHVEYTGNWKTDRVQASPRGFGHLAVWEIYEGRAAKECTMIAVIRAAANITMEKKNAHQ